MANRIKGEVEFQATSGDYTLLLDFNALCDLEDDFPGLMDGTADIKSPKAIRRVFHAGLAEYHPDLSERDAGAIIQDLGLDRAATLIKESFEASFPAPKGGAARPRKQSPGAGSAR